MTNIRMVSWIFVTDSYTCGTGRQMEQKDLGNRKHIRKSSAKAAEKVKSEGSNRASRFGNIESQWMLEPMETEIHGRGR